MLVRLALILASILSVPAAALTAPPFELAVLDVGQGDATVVVAPSGCVAVLDGGPKGSGPVIKNWLRSRGLVRVDALFVSHFHADHVGGADEIAQGADALEVVRTFDRGGTYSSLAYTEYATQYAGKRTTAVVGMTFSLCGEVTFQVVSVNANGTGNTDENARSVGVKVSYRDFDALIAGDLEETIASMETRVAPLVGEVELYKVHHHGSRDSSSDALLSKLKPQQAVVSVGLVNSYGHPHIEAMNRLAASGAVVWLTEDARLSRKLGNVEIASFDGRSYTVAQDGKASNYFVKGADLAAPTVPSDLVAAATGAHRIDLSWTPSIDQTAVAGYRVEWSADAKLFLPLATTTLPAWTDLDLPVDTDFWYRVSAFDSFGNLSDPSAPAHARTVDLQAPSQPQGLAAVALSATQIRVTWQPSSDDVGVTGYEVVQDNALVIPTTATQLVQTVGASTTHRFTVYALDAAQNVSQWAAETTVTTPCTVEITGKSWSASTHYLFVKAVSSDAATTLTATGDALLGSMIWSDSLSYFSIRRKLATQPACVTVQAACGATAVSCF